MFRDFLQIRAPCTIILRHSSNVGSMLTHRLRRWANIELALDDNLVFATTDSEKSPHSLVVY